MEIEINLSLRRLKLFNYNGVKGIYPVAIGKASTPTPIGNYRITRKVINPGGVLGTRWMELSIPSYDGPYGIHGTSMPWSIGKAASNGCIRMFNEDAEAVFRNVEVGTPVRISHGDIMSTPHQSNYQGQGGATQYYTVQPGDTLWKIANHFNVTVENLVRLNKIANPSMIYPGQKLRIN